KTPVLRDRPVCVRIVLHCAECTSDPRPLIAAHLANVPSCRRSLGRFNHPLPNLDELRARDIARRGRSNAPPPPPTPEAALGTNPPGQRRDAGCARSV